MRESVVEKHLRKQVIAKGGWIRKMVWPGHKGAPDRLVVWPGFRLHAPDGPHSGRPDVAKYLSDARAAIAAEMPGSAVIDFIECKAPKGPTADHQIREHNKLRALGCTVLILDSIEAVDRYIAERTS